MFHNTNVFIEYFSFSSFVIFSFIFCFFMLLAGFFLGGKSASRYKNTPFESGIASVGDTHLHFSVKFYLVAIFFVIFDVEALYLYAWSTSVCGSGWIGFGEAFMFIISLLVGLNYLIRVKAID